MATTRRYRHKDHDTQSPSHRSGARRGGEIALRSRQARLIFIIGLAAPLVLAIMVALIVMT